MNELKLRFHAICHLHCTGTSASKYSPGELTSRLGDELSSLSGFAISLFPQLVSQAVSLVGTIAFLFTQNSVLVLAAILGFASQTAMGFATTSGVQRATEAEVRKMASLRESLVEALSRMRSAIFCGLEERNIEEALSAQKEWSGTTMALFYRTRMIRATMESLKVIVASGLFLVALIFSDWESMSGGSLIASYMLVMRVQGPSGRFVELVISILSNRPLVTRVAHLFGTPSVAENCEIPESVYSWPGWPNLSNPAFFNTIRLDNVSVQLDGVLCLDEVDYVFERGKSYAIVGPNGAGKTTLLSILLGCAEPSSGHVLFDEKPCVPSFFTRLRRDSVIVSQEDMVWSASLEENINLDRTDIPAPTEREALLRQLDQLESLEGRTISRASVSTGQARLVSLLRALKRMPAYLVVLDEAERCLDSTGRALVWDTVLRANPEACIIAVTHDSSVTSKFDEVIVMKKGRIVMDKVTGRAHTGT